eukprot:g13581.t1
MGYAPNPLSVRSAGWEDDIGMRNEMEDGWIFIDCYSGHPNCCYFAIYDGSCPSAFSHGGRQCVDFVIDNLHKKLLVELQKEPHNVPEAMMQAFELTDEGIHTSGINTSGCTACCCLLRKELANHLACISQREKEQSLRVLYTAHIGDARAVLCRGGLAVRLTGQSDHKATDPAEANRVVEAGGNIFNDRVNGMLAISRAFGDFQLKAPTWQNDIVSNVPEVSSTLVSSQDLFVIMACDGLWDVVEDQEAVNLVIESMREFTSLAGDNSQNSRKMGQVLARVLIEEALAGHLRTLALSSWWADEPNAMYRSPMELRDLVQVYNDKKDKGQGPECDYGFKLIIIGDAGAGKSSFMHQFLEGRFRKQSTHTIGVEFGTKIISLGNRQIKLQIWDTAGQERYRAVTRSYYRGAVGALILYDVTSRDSYNNLPTWLQDAREQAWKDISIIAVGNKRDLKEERQVSFLEASRYAQEQERRMAKIEQETTRVVHLSFTRLTTLLDKASATVSWWKDILFLETSALTGENVQDVFHTLAQRILNKVEEGICDISESRTWGGRRAIDRERQGFAAATGLVMATTQKQPEAPEAAESSASVVQSDAGEDPCLFADVVVAS